MAFEDFTTYTAVTSGATVAIAASSVSFTAVPTRDNLAYVYKDTNIGANGTWNFDIAVSACATAYSGELVMWGITDSISGTGFYDWTNGAFVYIYVDATANKYWVGIGEAIDGTGFTAVGDSYQFVDDTTEYCTMIKALTVLTLNIYADSARTSLTTSVGGVFDGALGVYNKYYAYAGRDVNTVGRLMSGKSMNHEFITPTAATAVAFMSPNTFYWGGG